MDIPTHETIENAYRQAKEVTAKLPESTESRRAQEHLKLAEDYVHEARDRTKVDRVTAPELDASVEMRGPSMLGWGWPHATIDAEVLHVTGTTALTGNLTVSGGVTWRWADGSAP